MAAPFEETARCYICFEDWPHPDPLRQDEQPNVCRQCFSEFCRQWNAVEVRLKERAERSGRNGRVYFVQRDDGLVKIGTSRSLTMRLHDLVTEHGPLMFLGARNGGFDTERLEHSRFADVRVTGEWFQPVDELLAHAAAHNPWGAPFALSGRDAWKKLGRLVMFGRKGNRRIETTYG